MKTTNKPILIFAVVAVMMLVSAALADSYQFIITPGYDPAVASTNRCGIALSAVSSLATGRVPAPGVASSETSSRYRTLSESNTSSLNARKWRQFCIDFR